MPCDSKGISPSNSFGSNSPSIVNVADPAAVFLYTSIPTLTPPLSS